MQLTPELISEAVNRGILSRDQADELCRFLGQAPPAKTGSDSSFTFTNVLYYFGGLIAIGAMTLFMTLGWQQFGGWGIFTIATGDLWNAGSATDVAGRPAVPRLSLLDRLALGRDGTRDPAGRNLFSSCTGCPSR